MMIESLLALEDNYIYVYRYDGRMALVVDPGDADPVLDFVSQEGIEIRAVLNTHYHLDHVGGNETLKTTTDCEVIGPDKSRIPSLDRVVTGGERISFGPVEIEVISTPGHTESDVSYFMKGGPKPESAPVVWTGDTLFIGGCGRLFGGGAKALYGSLNRLAALPEETLVYCSHEYGADNYRYALTVEPDNEIVQARYDELLALRREGHPTVPSTMGEEKKSNIFLRAASKDVKAALQMADRNPFDVFVELRKRKDHFR
jgi:hydroxyacylglutathione hydrolase